MRTLLASALRWLWRPWEGCRAGLGSLAGPILLPIDFQAPPPPQQERLSNLPIPDLLPLAFPDPHRTVPSQPPHSVPGSTVDSAAAATDGAAAVRTIPQALRQLTANLWPTTLTPDPLDLLVSPSASTSLSNATMANEATLKKTLQSLHAATPASPEAAKLLSTAKKQLMQLDALIPSPSTPSTLLPLARAILEAGALLSTRAQDGAAFTRYYQQLQPFYALPASAYKPDSTQNEHQRSKITGLYLLQLLTKGDYAGFHTVLEGLEAESVEGVAGNSQADGVWPGGETGRFIRYPVELEQALMEGAYDRVWKATKGEGVPSEEFGVFSEILIGTIRAEIASCSEKAYPSIPIANAKNLLFLDSEGSVVTFAQERGWVVRDGRLYFPAQQNEGVRTEKEILVTSGTVIENTIGYARELETIV